MNPLYEKIRALIKLSCDGLTSCFDSDYIDSEGLSRQEESVGGISTDVDDEKEITFDGQSNMSIIFDEVVDNIEDKLPPSNDACVSWQTNCKGNEPADPQSHLMSTLFIEESAETANNWSSYSPAQLKKPQHPVLQSQQPRKRPRNANVSAAGKKMQPWLDSKTELTNLKFKLLQEEFHLKQQREKELHDQQLLLNSQAIEINNLKIEKLKEELAILKKTRN